MKKIAFGFVNLISGFLFDDFFSCIIRLFLYRMVGIEIGNKVRIFGGSGFYGKQIRIGSGCFVNRNCYFDATSEILLEDNVTIGHGVSFITANHKIGPSVKRAGEVDSSAIKIERGCWIGANVTILPGVTVGCSSVIAAGSVVVKNIPPNTLYAGVPARLIRRLNNE